jgi:hypothetical protein
VLGRCACLPTLKRAHEFYLLVLHSAMPNSCEQGLFSSMWLLQNKTLLSCCMSRTTGFSHFLALLVVVLMAV